MRCLYSHRFVWSEVMRTGPNHSCWHPCDSARVAQATPVPKAIARKGKNINEVRPCPHSGGSTAGHWMMKRGRAAGLQPKGWRNLFLWPCSWGQPLTSQPSCNFCQALPESAWIWILTKLWDSWTCLQYMAADPTTRGRETERGMLPIVLGAFNDTKLRYF